MTASSSNASAVDDLLDRLDRGLGTGDVPASIFGSQALYELELRRIFGRCWVFLAHESEIVNAGDYVLRRIGEDDFIVTRDRSGKLHALFNACRHRGVQVCRSDAGSCAGFTCPYHGWSYGLDGKLLGAPLWKATFGEMSKESNSLLSVAQLDTYHGLVFATLDPTAPSLRDYLGDLRWYLDLAFGLNEHGVRFLKPPQRFIVEANWKSPAENAAGDDYHVGTLHRSASEIGAFPVPFAENMKGYHIQAAPGHSLSFSMAMTEQDPGPRFFGFPEEMIASFNTSRISPEQLAAARMSRLMVMNIFPNLTVLLAPVTEDAKNRPPTAMLTLRVWQPKGVGKVEVWNWFAAYDNASPELKKRVYSAGLGTFSMAGLFEMDDAEPWITTARTARSAAAELLNLQLNYQMGLPSTNNAQLATAWPGPGVVYQTRAEEGVQRNLYRFYCDMMRTRPGEWPRRRLAG